jgi:ParB-like chromosome segregation protein Spo0J
MTASSSRHDPSLLLAKLEIKARDSKVRPRPPALLPRRIKQLPELFQPRGGDTDERHVQDLVRAVKTFGVLDPVLVMQVGNQHYLIDGHHRMAAYMLAGVSQPIPVQYFEGTPGEAVLAAGRENAKTKLPMTSRERQSYAWRLTVMDTYSKSMITSAACISDGQVAIMRRVRKALGAQAGTYRSWGKALSAARGQERFDMDEDALEVWKQEQAEGHAEKMAKACGPKLPNHPEIAAMALERYFGRRLEELVRELLDYMSDDFREQLRQDEL